MEKTVLVTVSDDRSGRKGFQAYSNTQTLIESLVGHLVEHKSYTFEGIREEINFNALQFGLQIEQREPALQLLNNIDPSKNGRVYKPLAIWNTLKDLNVGDFLIYNDCSPELWNIDKAEINNDYDINVLKSLTIMNNGILTAFVKWDNKPIHQNQLGRHTHRYFTTDLCLKTMNAESYIDSFQCASGFICIQKTGFTEKLIKEWLNFNLISECCALGKAEDPNDFSYWDNESTGVFDTEGFKLGHRHDQSILSIVLNKRNFYFVDILHNKLNPFNFLNFCRSDATYTFIHSNTGCFIPNSEFKIGEKVKNLQGIVVEVFGITYINNVQGYVVGVHRQSQYKVKREEIYKI